MRIQHAKRIQQSGDFAQAITARYATIERRWPLMALIFEQPVQADASVTNHYHVTHPSYFMSPRIILRMLVKHQAHHAYPIATAAAPNSNNVLTVQKVFSEHTKQDSIHIRSEEYITRIMSRTERSEIATDIKKIKSLSSAESQEGFVAQAKMDLPILFKRSMRESHDATATSERNEIQSTQNKYSNNSGNGTSPLPPTVDITRITDQVMQALDSRIVAQRERMGRI